MDSLLNEGEWEWYIKSAGFDECKCNIKHICNEPDSIPDKVMFSL